MTVSVNALPVDSVDLKIKDPFELAAEGNQTSAAGSQKLVNRRAELNEHSNEVNVILRDLEEDVDDLRVQEAWDGPTAAGAHDWATDRGMVFRALRRNHFHLGKTHTFLLTALGARLQRGLGGQIPAPPTDLWSILPLPFTDRLGHPVAVLSISNVARDEDGSLSELKEWTWWGLELVRRVIRDWWVDGHRGTGAEGVVLLIDVAGAGYRNMEVELLPTLFSVGNNNFPGQIESVYVINAGWSQRAMWNTVVKRVLPRSALDKVVFLQSRDETETVFDLSKLPKSLGGNGPALDQDAMLRKYSHIHAQALSRPGSRGPSRGNSRAGSRAPSRSGSRSLPVSRDVSMTRGAVSRNASMSSIADVYYTAPNSPAPSRPPSRPLSRRPSHNNASSLGLAGLVMTKTAPTVEDTAVATSKTDTFEAAAGKTLSRIKSLSDFHLYISPSRLAHRDLLSDSEDDEPAPPPAPPTVQRRVSLRPAMLEGSIAARRAAARAVATGETPARASTPQESYASKLQAHHAKNLEKYCARTDCSQFYRLDRSHSSSTEASPPSVESHLTPRTPEHEHSTPATTPSVTSPACEGPIEPATDVQFSADNPWFGYPVVRVQNGAGSYSIQPRYGRNRKRDLVKTLLWLLILRLQSLRASFENAIGLNKVVALFQKSEPAEPRTPTMGLQQTAVARRTHTHAYPPTKAVTRRHHDWIWMLIGFLLCRGTWAPFIAPGLESLGLGTLKGILGLV